MLTPTKHMNLDLSVVGISSMLLKLLKKNRIMTFDEMLGYLSGRIGNDVKHVFVPALNFLYLLGMIEYHLSTDSIEFVASKNT